MSMNKMIRDNMRPDTPTQVAERIRLRKAGAQAVSEREQRYPTLTVENAKEAIAFQERRMREILAEWDAQ